MMLSDRLFVAAASCALVASPIPSNLFARQTTPDGVRPGQYALLSSADVVDVKTKKIVAQMKDEYGKPMQSEKFLEMSFSNGKLVRTVSQSGQGIPNAVQARRSGRTPAAN